MQRTYYVYILTNRSGTLYVGMTGDLVRRVDEHRRHAVPGFTSRYKIDRLVYYETFQQVDDAIAREKQLKGWVRAKKTALIDEANPGWCDLWTQVQEPTEPERS